MLKRVKKTYLNKLISFFHLYGAIIMDRGTTKKYICIAQANVGMHKVTLHEGLQLLVCLWAEVNCMWQLQVYR